MMDTAEEQRIALCRERRICVICHAAGNNVPSTKVFRWNSQQRFSLCDFHYEESRELRDLVMGRI